MSYKEEFIEFMTRSGALLFGDFTTKSGRQSPYFINTGSYRTGEQIARLGRFYADCIEDHMAAGHIPSDTRALFGPAYKGIPIAVSAAIALSERGRPMYYCFNRKEVKDHGERGEIVGYSPKDGDGLLITEDVVTAGTAFRETLPVLKRAAVGLRAEGLIVSVDRMERGAGDKSASKEIFEEYGVRTFPIVTVREIVAYLYNRPVDGRVLINDDVKERMDDYFARYCICAE
ncbi:MAG: orotate phosphoribosyltransferase [Clostridiales Family XIII bacterium]|jgi:orotate phosphoribosyltransferase|nr:orotate phosphoribosyltransferase [Clostridiales Family XIII bacterium]